MMRPVILLTDPKTEWAKVMRATIHKLTKFTMTGSETKLKRLVRLHPSRIIVIIDTRLASNPGKLIEEVKNIHGNVVILAATSSLSWEDTVVYIKAGAAEILIKTMDPEQITASLHVLDTTHDNLNKD